MTSNNGTVYSPESGQTAHHCIIKERSITPECRSADDNPGIPGSDVSYDIPHRRSMKATRAGPYGKVEDINNYTSPPSGTLPIGSRAAIGPL